jgi:hypothetical protein
MAVPTPAPIGVAAYTAPAAPALVRISQFKWSSRTHGPSGSRATIQSIAVYIDRVELSSAPADGRDTRREARFVGAHVEANYGAMERLNDGWVPPKALLRYAEIAQLLRTDADTVGIEGATTILDGAMFDAPDGSPRIGRALCDYPCARTTSRNATIREAS